MDGIPIMVVLMQLKMYLCWMFCFSYDMLRKERSEMGYYMSAEHLCNWREIYSGRKRRKWIFLQ